MATYPLGALAVARRTSRLFSWESADLSLTARTGQVGTFARNDTQPFGVLDSNGRFGPSLPNQPRFIGVDTNTDGVNDAVGLVMEATTTNLVKQNCACATTPWTLVAGTTPTNAAGTFAGLSFSRFANASTSAMNQQITLTGNGVKAVSFCLKHDGQTGTVFITLFDATASAHRCLIQATMNADGSISVVAQIGTLVAVQRLADGVVWVLAQSTSVTAASSHQLYANDGAGAGGTCTSYLGSAFQVEDSPAPSSPIVTGAATGSRAADALTWPIAFFPQALSMYVKYIDRVGPALAGQTQRLFRVSSSGSSVADLLIDTAPSAEFEAGGADADSAVNAALSLPAAGSLVELFGSWQADSTTAPNKALVTVSYRVNGGAITTATNASASRLPATGWTDGTVELNNLFGNQWPHVFLAARIAPGISSLPLMCATA